MSSSSVYLCYCNQLGYLCPNCVQRQLQSPPLPHQQRYNQAPPLQAFPDSRGQQYNVYPPAQYQSLLPEPVQRNNTGRRRTYSVGQMQAPSSLSGAIAPPVPPIPQPHPRGGGNYDQYYSSSQRATYDQYGHMRPIITPAAHIPEYSYGGIAPEPGPSSSRSRRQRPLEDSPLGFEQETPSRGRHRERHHDTHGDHRRAASMHPAGSASGPACPVCDHVDPPEWRFGKVSQTMVCNACSKYEDRHKRLRSKAKEADRDRRMKAGARR
ncbi:hypothetical protein HMN09_00776500 [Mycena chlorophos]|uniref:GATA-type domain-containing protein n=1 Tax=Mycena chlorophos TaxID=658473 RepID=A0A8H6STL6_MYCCL|nr:hypothetical protein HMN09_00776500 [Mycena chlorophos]